MSLLIKSLLTILALTAAISCYVDITDHDDHMNNIYTHNYVLSLLYESAISANLGPQLASVAELLTKSEKLTERKVFIELIDVTKIPFLNTHYRLNGKPDAKIFIRSRKFDFQNFYSKVEELQNGYVTEQDLTATLEQFIIAHLSSISTLVETLEQFNALLGEKGMLGVFFGPKGANYNKYFHVARKNLDFNFAHIHDPALRDAIFEELPGTGRPQSDFMAVIRHKRLLNEFDNQQIVVGLDFKEKALTELLEYERFEKLRDPSQAGNIVKRMYSKGQPLMLYVKGSGKESEGFKAFKEVLKTLPKRFIFSYTELESESTPHYLQMFMLAQSQMVPESLYIVWIMHTRKPKVEMYTGEIDAEGVGEFIFKFYKEHEYILDSLGQHLYDKEMPGQDGILSEEL